MKTFQQLKALASRVNAKTATLALAPVVALQSSSVWAALPEVQPPSDAIGGGSVSDGDWMGAMGGYFKAAFTILALVFVAGAFIYVLMGAWRKWQDYSSGRGEISQIVEYFVMAAVFGLFVVVIATYALKTLE